MSEWIDVAPVEDLAPGEHRVVDLDDQSVAVFNLGGEYCAIEDRCTHDGAPLTGGRVEDGVIICPRHGARFCLRSGAVLSPPAYEPVLTFPVRMHEGRVQVCDPRSD